MQNIKTVEFSRQERFNREVKNCCGSKTQFMLRSQSVRDLVVLGEGVVALVLHVHPCVSLDIAVCKYTHLRTFD